MIGFGNFSKRNTEITTLSDPRLMPIDPTKQDFFNKLFNVKSDKEDINNFIEAAKVVQDNNLAPFWKPRLAPSIIDGKISFIKGKEVALGHDYEWWEAEISKMSPVENHKWVQSSELQYYAFLIELVNLSDSPAETVLNELIVTIAADVSLFFQRGNCTYPQISPGCALPERKNFGIKDVYDLGVFFKFLKSSFDENYYWLGSIPLLHPFTGSLASLMPFKIGADIKEHHCIGSPIIV